MTRESRETRASCSRCGDEGVRVCTVDAVPAARSRLLSTVARVRGICKKQASSSSREVTRRRLSSTRPKRGGLRRPKSGRGGWRRSSGGEKGRKGSRRSGGGRLEEGRFGRESDKSPRGLATQDAGRMPDERFERTWSIYLPRGRLAGWLAGSLPPCLPRSRWCCK